MLFIVLAYAGGVLTILSPCILPVLPFVFARAQKPFLQNGLPLLLGMVLTFAGIATLAAVGGSWAIRINQYGRVVALALMAAFAATLLSRRLADWLTRPLVGLGGRLSEGGESGGVGRSLLLGAACGLLWAPCAGPILGLVLTGAAVAGPTTQTTFLLLAYAAGAATSLGLATLAGAKVFAALKRSLGAGEWIRRGLGIAVLLGVVIIAFGWDSGVLTRVSIANTNQIEESLINSLGARKHSPTSEDATAMSGGAMNNGAMNGSMSGSMSGSMNGAMMAGGALQGAAGTAQVHSEGQLPEFTGVTAWLNSPPLEAAALHGKVVLVDFWTYSCINCLRSLPYVKSWYAKYKDYGLVVIGVHAPEFAFEKDESNVRRAVHDLGITYPVVLDNNYVVWQAFNNEYWPAHYFVDGAGRIRGHHFGEGDYAGSEQTLRQLLIENGAQHLPAVTPAGDTASAGVEAPADAAHMQSPETYIGYARAEHFAGPAPAHDQSLQYSVPADLALNQWGLVGAWTVGKDVAVLSSAPGKIVFRFFARDLHLVLGASADGKPVRFKVQIDGRDPGADHGVDTDAKGDGNVREQRLYQLIRQSQSVVEHTFSIEFLDPGVQAYSFTFG